MHATVYKAFSYQQWGLGVALLMGLVVSLPSQANTELVDQLIIKYRADAQARLSKSTMRRQLEATVEQSTGLKAAYKRPMADITGAHVIRLPYAMTLEDAKIYAASIQQQDAEIEYVEPDSLRYARQVRPNDPEFTQQWYLASPQEHAGAANLVNAWTVTTGSPEVVVAVLDSGVTNHVDLRANLVGGSSTTAGYDLISVAADANDNDGRDADPTDVGRPNDSSLVSAWHGTHVAGIVGAVTNNALGIAGVGGSSRILAVRVLSASSGTLSDEVDGMLWAAGESVPGLPVNPQPAQILNLSVGTDSYQTCARIEQDAISRLVSKGIAVVTAAGNENRNVSGSAPANCQGVIAVTGVTKGGARAAFANYGAGNTIAAPAESILSLYNTGTRQALADSYHSDSGTSQATPIVAGVLALMLAANPKLRDPAVIPTANLTTVLREKLQASARAFPSQVAGASGDSLACNANQETACVCTKATCGAGLVDAYQAVKAVSSAPLVKAGTDQVVNFNTTVTLNGTESHDDTWGGKLIRYTWTQTAGPTVNLEGANSATVRFTAPATATNLTFQLTATDDTGLSASDTVDIKVEAKTTTSSGGGGGLSLPLLMLLAMFGGWSLLRQRR